MHTQFRKILSLALASLMFANPALCAEHRPLAGAEPAARHRRHDHRPLGHCHRHLGFDRCVPLLALWHSGLPPSPLGAGRDRRHRGCADHRDRDLGRVKIRNGNANPPIPGPDPAAKAHRLADHVCNGLALRVCVAVSLGSKLAGDHHCRSGLSRAVESGRLGPGLS